MNVRERTLSIVVVLLLLGLGGNIVVKRVLLEPIAAKRRQLDQAKQEIDLKRRQREQLRLAAKKLEVWRSHSLPPDPDIAPSRYQAWLAEQAEKAGFNQAKVSPQGRPAANRSKDIMFYRYPFSIRASTSLQGLVDFLHAFYSAPLLHQMQQINVSPATGRRAGSLDVTITVEGLALLDAPRRDTLFVQSDGDAPPANRAPGGAGEGETAGTEAPGSATSTTVPSKQSPVAAALAATIARLASQNKEHYQLIVDRNVFAPFQPPPASNSGPDAAQYYNLTAVLSVIHGDNEEPEGVLYSALDDQYVSLRAGENFEVADVKGRVISVDQRQVTLQTDQGRRLLRLGSNLRQLVALPDGPAEDSTGNDEASE